MTDHAGTGLTLRYFLSKADEALLAAHRLEGIDSQVERVHPEADKWIELARLIASPRT